MRTQILEKGHVIFLYKPKVNHEEVKYFNDIQKMHLLLKPLNISREHPCRLFTVPKKTLPSISQHQVLFSFIAEVSESIDVITQNALKDFKYETRVTHKPRIQGADTPVGE